MTEQETTLVDVDDVRVSLTATTRHYISWRYVIRDGQLIPIRIYTKRLS